MVCPKCKAENPDIAQFCRQCGGQMVIAQRPVSASDDNKPKKGFFRRLFRIGEGVAGCFGLAIIMLVVVGLIIFVLVQFGIIR